MTEEDALWQAIGAAPEDQLPRLVAADWYDERAGMVYCPLCKGDEQFGRPCKVCKATGRTSNGHAETAAALRATVGWLPNQYADEDPVAWYWFGLLDKTDEVEDFHDDPGCRHFIPRTVALCLSREWKINSNGWPVYPTAADAIRDLCRAYVASRNKREVPT